MKINNKCLALATVYSVAVKLITNPNVGLSLKTDPVGILADFFATLLITYGLLILVIRVVNSRRGVTDERKGLGDKI